MKSNHILSIVLGILAVLFAVLWLSARSKPPEPPSPPKEMWHTNTVQMWRTNTIDRWHTNTVERWVTNTVNVETSKQAEPTIKEVIKEVPVQLTAQQKQAGAAGEKYLRAPSLAGKPYPFYKASPIGVDIELAQGAQEVFGEDADALRQRVESGLSAHKIPHDARSPYRLKVGLSVVWTSNLPRSVVYAIKLELVESAALQRQNDIVKSSGVVWTSTKSGITTTFDGPKDTIAGLRAAIDEFGQAYLKSKDSDRQVESLIPAVPALFLP